MNYDVAGIAISLLSVIVAISVAYLTYRWRRQEKGQHEFRQVRRSLKLNVAELVQRAERAQRGFLAEPDIHLLTRPGWIPERPVPLRALRLTLLPAPPTDVLDSARRKVASFWPHDAGARMKTYSEAIGQLDRPGMWFNGPSYRLLDVRRPPVVDSRTYLEFAFCRAHYFDAIDTAEPLAYEIARRHLRNRRQVCNGPYRRWLGDPFDFSRRCALPGVNTLTLRLGKRDVTFFLHIREVGLVASMNTTHVVPAGEFQPHSDVLTTSVEDFDIWRTMMREYAEEFGLADEVSGNTGTVIDFSEQFPFKQFSNARRANRVKPYFLGLGLEPITWKPELCTVCVWDGNTFDRIFSRMLTENQEGRLIVGSHKRGIDFNEDNVMMYAHDAGTDPAGRVCLLLAWRWRTHLVPALR